MEEHLTTALDALADGNPGLAELAASTDYKVNTMEIDLRTARRSWRGASRPPGISGWFWP